MEECAFVGDNAAEKGEKSAKKRQKNLKKHLQNGNTYIIIIRHGNFSVVNLHHTPGDHAPQCLAKGGLP